MTFVIFIVWTLWTIVVAVAVNVFMEKWWARRSEHPAPPRNEQGSIQFGRHRG